MYAARKAQTANLQKLLMVDGSLDPEDHVIAGIRAAIVDDLDHVIAGLPELTAVFLVRRHLFEEERVVGIEYLVINPGPPGRDADV